MSSQQRKSNPHSRTRQDHATELAEDYVEAIGEFTAKNGTCRAVDLVGFFQVSHVTVNKTLGRLQRDGYVTKEPYGPVELTAAGRRMASASKRRHEVVLKFLLALGVDESTAKIDAEGIEHHVSPQTLKLMEEFAAHRQFSESIQGESE